jgi:ASC-1-like (ASCH) protein
MNQNRQIDTISGKKFHNQNKSKDRVFIPLSQEPYYWFLSGKKKWELRKTGRQFTAKNIQDGRVVELRRGYNTKDSIWGKIEKVLEFNTLEEVFEAVCFKEVIPVATCMKQAISIAKSILNPSNDSTFIIFKITPYNYTV